MDEVEKALKTEEMDRLIKDKSRVSLREQIAKLLGRREVVLYAMTGGLFYGLVSRIIDPKDFLILAGMVFSYYFAQRGSKQVIQ